MIEIRNLLFQPLAFHMSGDVGGIHLGSRERKTIADDQLSDEIRTAADRGFVSLTSTTLRAGSAQDELRTSSDVPGSTLPDPRADMAIGEHYSEPISNSEPQARQKKGSRR